MTEFNVGDKVLLKKSSHYYNNQSSSRQLPPFVVGTVEYCDDFYRVEWEENGVVYGNGYDYEDLKLAMEIVHPTLIFNDK